MKGRRVHFAIITDQIDTSTTGGRFFCGLPAATKHSVGLDRLSASVIDALALVRRLESSI
jgi:DNA invertase Pin-like site-specific DNA recombinase